ncbi:2-oxoglutarate dehydrogenase complex dihydrolipoyllysine-residue succinyltransferase [Paludisphaera mucosa]|uniref:Dihydrolipoyllysine-residue succinyltransferase component of 2-oxoglutarate dehydrogenase complex n=1 Tax=Paludisphaera mucosa TaxID=3030827 RepID=A0ABT6FCJ5_9BACT|nr:2-oxoglutarate dehydrogenase complex dihydrolipoyllysine-residue succinyltransferase [Paludisphaera mucosa]MDG3005164.1 2-oxoglutarate dehydrogenase complex dihydrolipoyllysine-residue succinyltransferase [Paludisphaera mucosa]
MSAVPISVPGVGESISEGILAKWLAADGSAVKAGDPLFELETDKATNVVPAPASGVLKVQAAEGDTVAIGATVGVIDPSGAPAAAKAAPEKTEAKPAPAAPAAPATGADGAEHLSPAVRRIVAEEGVDPASVEGTGKGGRVTKGDVLARVESGPVAPAPTSAPAPAAKAPAPAPAPTVAAPKPAARAGRETRERMSGLRQRIAQRLVEAQHTAAILTTFNEVDLTRVMATRTKYKEAFQKAHGTSLGFMSFFVKATIEALKAFPAVNARIEGLEIVYQNYYNIGVAVSTERGLMVPVIRDADALSFAEIEKAIGVFADKARKGTIGVDDLQGGTFTITNGGVFGSLVSTPILNPPQSAILGMHAIKKRPVVVDDQIVIRPMMYLALSYDHRLIDGREAVSSLVRIKDCLEDPERMLLSL